MPIIAQILDLWENKKKKICFPQLKEMSNKQQRKEKKENK